MSRNDGLSCRGFVSLIDDYLDAELSESERSSVGAHLESCADCRSYLHRARIILAALAARPPRADDASRAQLDELRQRLAQGGPMSS